MMRKVWMTAGCLAGVLGLGACDFSAGVGDQASQQREVRALAGTVNQGANACVTSWLAQRDLTVAGAQGQGDRAAVAAAVGRAETACREAARGFQDARPPAIVNRDNQALMRTAFLACQTAYADVASQLAIKATVVTQPNVWTTPAHEEALQRMFGSMRTCERDWNAAMAPLVLTDVTVATLNGGAPAATTNSAPASGTAPDNAGAVLTPTEPGQSGQYGKLPPGGAPVAPPPAISAPEPAQEVPSVDGKF